MAGAGRNDRKEGGRGEGAAVVTLRLYLADHAPASVAALANLRAALDGVPAERYKLQVLDALSAPLHALSDGVLTVPALLRGGEPVSVVTGTLADPAEVLTLLEGVSGGVRREGLLSADGKREAASLAGRVTATRRELQALVGEGVDMVLDRAGAAPVVLPGAEQAVRDDAQNFRRIFEEAPLGMAILSRDFRLVRANRRLSDLTGLPPSQLLQMGLSDLTGESGGCIEELNLTGERSCEAGFCEGDTLYRKEGGGEIWLRLSVALVPPAEGHPYFLLMVQDVTEMKLAEAELFRYHGQLEDLVRERTAELASANRKLMKEIEERLEAEDAVRALNEELEERVRERTAELEESNRQLETMNRFFVGRELRMAELKREVVRLEKELSDLRLAQK